MDRLPVPQTDGSASGSNGGGHGMPISVEEAITRIEGYCQALEPCAYPLLEAVGLVLAEAPVSDMAMPPFDKSAVDGVAVRSDDAVEGRQLQVVDELLAGSVPSREVRPSLMYHVWRPMTCSMRSSHSNSPTISGSCRSSQQQRSSTTTR